MRMWGEDAVRKEGSSKQLKIGIESVFLIWRFKVGT